MLANQEIFEFFKEYPNTVRPKCIQEVLVYATRLLRKKFPEGLCLSNLLKLNENCQGMNYPAQNKRDFTPKFKEGIKKEVVQDTDRLRMVTARGLKENVCPDTTCLPLKVENRRTQSTQLPYMASTKMDDSKLKTWKFSANGGVADNKLMTWKFNANNGFESFEKESEVIRLADEFLKNPFMKMLVKHNRHESSPRLLFDSNLFSTIEMNSPSVYVDM